MSPLPELPAEALHLLPPASLLALLALAGMIVLLLALLVARRLLRRRQQPVADPPATPPAAPQASPATGIASRIQALERESLKTKAFRKGCHSLAMLIKSHLAQVTGLATERMTSSEIERAIGKLPVADPRVGGFITALSRRRYGRVEPRRRDFVAACEQARELLG